MGLPRAIIQEGPKDSAPIEPSILGIVVLTLCAATGFVWWRLKKSFMMFGHLQARPRLRFVTFVGASSLCFPWTWRLREWTVGLGTMRPHF